MIVLSQILAAACLLPTFFVVERLLFGAVSESFTCKIPPLTVAKQEASDQPPLNYWVFVEGGGGVNFSRGTLLNSDEVKQIAEALGKLIAQNGDDTLQKIFNSKAAATR